MLKTGFSAALLEVSLLLIRLINNTLPHECTYNPFAYAEITTISFASNSNNTNSSLKLKMKMKKKQEEKIG